MEVVTSFETPVRDVAFSPDGSWLAAGEDGGAVHLFETEHFEKRSEWHIAGNGGTRSSSGPRFLRDDAPPAELNALWWTHDSRYMLIADELYMQLDPPEWTMNSMHVLQLWDVETPSVITTIPLLPGSFNIGPVGTEVHVNASGRFFATPTETGRKVKFWSLPAGELLGTLVLFHDGEWIFHVPDGRHDGSPRVSRHVVRPALTPQGRLDALGVSNHGPHHAPGLLHQTLGMNAP
jgi:WD40 repeat protein